MSPQKAIVLIGTPMIAVFLSAFLVRPNPQAPLDRYAAFRKAHPAFEVVCIESKLRTRTLFEVGQRIRFEAKGGGIDYVLSADKKGGRELDRPSQTYDEFVGTAFRPAEFRLSNAPRAMPSWLFQADLRNLMPKKATWTAAGTQEIRGEKVDIVKSEFGNPQQEGQQRANIAINAAGQVRRLELSGESPMGQYRYAWEVESMRGLPRPAATVFSLPIPDGFSPYAFDEAFGPLGIGSKFPTAGWRDASGKPLKIAGDVLIAVLGQDCEPSQRALPMLARLRSGGRRTLLLTLDAQGPSGAKMDGFAAVRTLESILGLPSTPAFFRVKPNGQIQAVWLGFDPAKATEMEREMKA